MDIVAGKEKETYKPVTCHFTGRPAAVEEIRLPGQWGLNPQRLTPERYWPFYGPHEERYQV